jgi:hypothetical protein
LCHKLQHQKRNKTKRKTTITTTTRNPKVINKTEIKSQKSLKVVQTIKENTKLKAPLAQQLLLNSQRQEMVPLNPKVKLQKITLQNKLVLSKKSKRHRLTRSFQELVKLEKKLKQIQRKANSKRDLNKGELSGKSWPKRLLKSPRTH